MLEQNYQAQLVIKAKPKRNRNINADDISTVTETSKYRTLRMASGKLRLLIINANVLKTCHTL